MITSINDILSRLQFLKPDIQVAVYDGKPMQTVFTSSEGQSTVEDVLMDGWTFDVQLDNFYIRYAEIELFRPTADDILAVSDETLNTYLESQTAQARELTKAEILVKLNELKSQLDGLN